MTTNDTVKEAPYCIICRHSTIVKWHKHVFSYGHQKAAQQFLLLQVNRLQTFYDTITLSSLTPWRCVFCNATFTTHRKVLAHVASTFHRKQVERFCRQHRCDVKHQMRSQLWLQATRWQELEMLIVGTSESADQVETQDQVEDGHGKRVDTFLSVAAGRLQAVENKRWQRRGEAMPVESGTKEEHEVFMGPQGAVGKQRCKTVISSEGVVQNPLGRHQGKRVWGGGIVKLRTNEWIPWTIDQLVKEEQTEQLNIQQTGMETTTPYTHRLTEIARGEGLSSITPVSWVANVGNVHTAAVPPWMVQTEEEYKTCNNRQQTAISSVVATRLTNMRDKTRNDIFSKLPSQSEYKQDWLPNFGGVWQDGPRSKTKQAFRKAANAAKPLRPCNQVLQSKSIPSQLQAQNRLERVSSVTSQEPQPSAAVQEDYIFEQRQEVHSFSYSDSNKNESKIEENSLDARKQLLLVQKKRLRAKMAARRRAAD